MNGARLCPRITCSKRKALYSTFICILCIVVLLSISLLLYVWDFNWREISDEKPNTGVLISPTQVMLASDRLVGMLATINSIVSNTVGPVKFYLITSEKNVQHLRMWIMDSKLQDISFKISSIDIGTTLSVNGTTEISLAKAYIPLIFPEIQGPIVYVDDDCIVQGDIAQLASMLPQSGHYGLFSSDCNSVSKRFTFAKNTYANYINFNNPDIKALQISPGACSFDIGVFVVNITEWRRIGLTEKLTFWIKSNEKERIASSQAVGEVARAAFMLTFYRQITTMDPMWNVRHLGITSAARYSRNFLKQAKLIHWDGKFKPWGRRSSNTDFWQRYYVPNPTGQFHLIRMKPVVTAA